MDEYKHTVINQHFHNCTFPGNVNQLGERTQMPRNDIDDDAVQNRICNICNKLFASKQNRDNHARKYHNVNNSSSSTSSRASAKSQRQERCNRRNQPEDSTSHVQFTRLQEESIAITVKEEPDCHIETIDIGYLAPVFRASNLPSIRTNNEQRIPFFQQVRRLFH
ncbi:uncharacterized protein LOC116342191 [Contarinia nasturtii]|uniref:uncharacterized protein LOC116342191 n=1 Tax=Contarinia nasturtii TaxID=265458 RepID=UPI0012D48E6A|nr:uncharacterized protein LOC116342191 [Contarinia nasturtii]